MAAGHIARGGDFRSVVLGSRPRRRLWRPVAEWRRHVALVVVTASTLLLSIVAVEVDTRLDVDVDRELRVNGLANILVGLLGGMVGTLSVSRTMFNYRVGARHRSSALLAGALCLATLAWGTEALGYIPVPLLGALLLEIGAGMLNDWLIKSWKRMQRADYFQVVGILFAIIRWDFVAGIAVGVIAACVTFAVNTSRIRLVKLGLTRSDYASRVERSASQSEQLLRWGQGIQIMWLHGFVFFGSANRLLIDIKGILAAHGNGVAG